MTHAHTHTRGTHTHTGIRTQVTHAHNFSLASLWPDLVMTSARHTHRPPPGRPGSPHRPPWCPCRRVRGFIYSHHLLAFTSNWWLSLWRDIASPAQPITAHASLSLHQSASRLTITPYDITCDVDQNTATLPETRWPPGAYETHVTWPCLFYPFHSCYEADFTTESLI